MEGGASREILARGKHANPEAELKTWRWKSDRCSKWIDLHSASGLDTTSIHT